MALSTGPVQEYHELLARDVPAARQQFDALRTDMRRRGLLYGGQDIPTFLRPRLLNPAVADMLRDTTRTLMQAFRAVEGLVDEEPSYLDRLGLPEDEQSWIRSWKGDLRTPSMAFGRLDGFLVPSPKFVEYNADSPGGAAFTDEMSAAFRRLPVVREFARSYSLQAGNCSANIFSVLVKRYQAWSGQTRRPQCVIADWLDVGTSNEFYILSNYFERRGMPTRTADPRSLVYRNGRLYLEDFRIDIVYKRVVTRELLDRADDCRDLLQACRDDAVCMVNPIRCKVQNVKTAMAALWDPRLQSRLSRSQLQTVQSSMPWTWWVEEGYTERQGERIDIIRYILQHRAELVLKPIDDYGGAGVTLGWTVSDTAWQAAVNRALQSRYIVQEKVDIPTEPFPVFDSDGSLKFEELYVDADPYIFDRHIGSIGCRISGSPLLNVKTGGGVVPTFTAVPR